MLKPRPTQLTGATFLSSRRNALLADEPRVGKTGAAIMACDDNFEDTVLVVTTASGRAVWERAWRQWSQFDLGVQVLAGGSAKLDPKAERAVVSWGDAGIEALRKRRWTRVIADESHYAKNFDAVRTQAVYGGLIDDGYSLADGHALTRFADGVWCLTGTPIPNANNDLYPMLRALAPGRLALDGMPIVMRQSDFVERYCVVRQKKLPGGRRIPVVVAGRNTEELNRRLRGFMLQRTQADVGIAQPVYETLPLRATEAMRRDIDGRIDAQKVLDAARNGDTNALTMHLGPIRRLTGTLKSPLVIQAVSEELDNGTDKIVIAYWHRETGDLLQAGLSKYGVIRLDGATPQRHRNVMELRFSQPDVRVFLGQIVAAGEAIDLSPASELLFAETSLVPKDMKQMALRITNYTQSRLPRVRVAVLHGSIDESVEDILIRKWSNIREVLTNDPH